MGEWDTGYATITDPADDDTLLIRDVSDNGVIAAGKIKQVTVGDLGAAIGGGGGGGGLPVPSGSAVEDSLPAATGTGDATVWKTISQLLNPAAFRFPNNDDTGTADTAMINEVIANNGKCTLLQAPLAAIPYYVSSPLLPASGSGIKGAQPWASSQNDSYGPAGAGYSGGTTIYAVSAFAGAAIIAMINATGTQYSGVSLEDFCLEGFSTGGSGCHGILVDGAWGAGFISGVTVHRPDQDCLHFQADVTSGDEPDEWEVTRTKLSGARNGYGVWADNLPDSVFAEVNSSENNLDGWLLNWSTNTRLNDCKSENNGGAGFHLTGMGYPNAALAMTTCTTHLNQFDGWLFDNPNSNPNGQYQLANCFSVDDGQAGGTTYAGYRSDGSPARIMGANCFAYGAAYGAYQGGSATGEMTFTGSALFGTTAATGDDDSNATPLANVVPVGGPYAFATAVTSGVVTLAYASTLTIDASLGGHFRMPLTGNATVNITNPTDGQKITVEPIQDATGGRTLTWSSSFSFGSGTAPGLSGANKGDLLGFVYSANRGKWLSAGAGVGGF